MFKFFCSALLVLTYNFSIAQDTLAVPRNLQATYAKGTRSKDGRPGKQYWQNTADYDLYISYDPMTRYLAGTVNITYINNSPDTLQELWFKLYPNLYKKGVQRMTVVAPEDEGEGVKITSLELNGKSTNVPIANGTNMRLAIDKLLPGQQLKLKLVYNYTVNKGSHNRTGEVEQGAAFIAYFFPRIAVYDDIDGWNKNPYLGPQEFYNDFCNFKAAITVPGGFGVWATGDLKNCSEVFRPAICARIQQAEKSDTIIEVITPADLANRQVTGNTSNTFKFEAANVTDFAFATSDHYLWRASAVVVDSATGRRTRADAVFNPLHEDYFEVADFARKTVSLMSHRFPKWPFPYPHITVFDGLDQMEYPMMVNDNPVDNRTDAITLTDHEIFHTMFPFYMGTNETKYAWMDEGWATLGEWLLSPMIDPTVLDDYGIKPYERAAGSEIDLSITTLSTQQHGEALFLNAYPKPALGYLYVKDLLGDSLFLKALHFYIDQWKGKHPMPYDFFNAMNTGSGKNLNWFWKRWFFDIGYPDLALEKVTGKANKYTIIIRMKGSKPVPVDLVLHYADASTTTVHRGIDVWQNNNTLTLTVDAERPVQKVTLGSLYIPDVNRADNTIVLIK